MQRELRSYGNYFAGLGGMNKNGIGHTESSTGSSLVIGVRHTARRQAHCVY